MQRLLTVMGDHPSAWAFDHPVNAAEVTDYYDVIKRPMGSSLPSTSAADYFQIWRPCPASSRPTRIKTSTSSSSTPVSSSATVEPTMTPDRTVSLTSVAGKH